MSSPQPSAGPPGGTPGWVSSVVALVLGLVLSVSVSGLFSSLGWGGDLASQTAGATSGAAPLLVDGFRHRRALRRGGPGVDPTGGRPDWPRKLLIVACFGFVFVVVESAIGWFVFHLARWTVHLAHGPDDRFKAVYTLLGGLLIVPSVLTVLYLLSLAAGRRLREHRRRWILLGMAIYAVVRIANVLAARHALVQLVSPGGDTGTAVAEVAIVVGAVLTLALLCLVAILGVGRARRTQAAFDASSYVKRLEPGDREAALALLDDAGPVRRRPERGPWTPPPGGPGPPAAPALPVSGPAGGAAEDVPEPVPEPDLR